MDEDVKKALGVVVNYMCDSWLTYMNPQTIIFKKRATGESVRLCQIKSYIDKGDSAVYAYFEALLNASSKILKKESEGNKNE